MFKPSATIHKSPDGEVKALAVSEDAGVCLKAFKECEQPGEVVYIRKGHTDKMKKVEDPKQVKAHQKLQEGFVKKAKEQAKKQAKKQPE